MVKVLFCAALLAMAALPTASAEQVAGVELADAVRIEGGRAAMPLAGAAVRQHNFTPLYLTALYQPAGRDAVPDEYTEKQITLVWLTPRMSDERCDAYWRDAIANGMDDPEQFRRIEQSIDRFVDLFDEVARGDTFIFEYLPDQGTRIIINGEDAGLITGIDFHRALLGVWFSDDPRQADFVRALLGQS